MADTVTPASKPTSSEVPKALERLAQYAEEHPEKNEYRITSELEAAEILTMLAATLKLGAKQTRDREYAKKLRDFSHVYKLQVKRGNALEYIRQLSEEEELVIYGMKLTAPRITLN